MTDTSRSRCDKLMAAARYIYIYTCFAILDVYLCDREEKKKENQAQKKRERETAGRAIVVGCRFGEKLDSTAKT